MKKKINGLIDGLTKKEEEKAPEETPVEKVEPPEVEKPPKPKKVESPKVEKTPEPKKEEKKVAVKAEDLVGTWNGKSDAAKKAGSLTFTKDGKFEQSVPQKGGTLFLKGKYSIDAGNLVLKVELGTGYEEVYMINEYKEDFMSITRTKAKGKNPPPALEYTRKVDKK